MWYNFFLLNLDIRKKYEYQSYRSHKNYEEHNM